MEKEKVAIIIVTMNQKKLLKECLKSLKQNTGYKNYKVIVSDNGSTDGSIEMIKKEFKLVDLIENGKNLYWAGGNNTGIKYSLDKYNPNYLFLLNDDTKIIQKDWLNKLIETAESDSKIGIVGCNLIYPDKGLQHSGGYIKGPFITVEKEEKGIKDVDHVMGAAIMIKKEVIEKIGFIDEIFTPYLLDETDYCLRAKRSGFGVLVNRNVKIIHYKGQTINNLDKELKGNFVRLKNDSIFSFINLSFPYAFIRIFFYLPFVMILKKKEERGRISIKNIKFRKSFLRNILNILKGYFYLIHHLKLILKKRKERKLKKDILFPYKSAEQKLQ